MIPGPVDVEDEVLEQMGAPVIAHYGKEWVEVYRETIGYLKQIFRTEGDVYILIGSGSAGLDAAIGSMLGGGESVLVIVNGFFGERLLEIARSYHLSAYALESEWGKPASPKAIEDVIKDKEGFQAVAVVHHETSTGVMNPVEKIGEICKRYDIPLIVDAVSSLGGSNLAVDEWGIDVCVSSSQKCLEAPPGLSPVAITSHAWQVMEEKGDLGHGWYLNLLNWRNYVTKWADWHPHPVTMATNTILALRASLKRILDEGLEERGRRFKRIAERLRDGLRELDFELLIDGEYSSSVVTSVISPPGISPDEIRNFLKNEYDLLIAGGIGSLKDKIFRIGHIGKSASPEYIDYLLSALKDFRQRRGGRYEAS